MAHVITQTDIVEINKAYERLKTYAAVSRELGYSPATVKKYVIPGYRAPKPKKIFNGNLPEIDYAKFLVDDWAPICQLSEEEVAAIHELWEELDA